MKVLATASLMVLALFSGCTSGAFAPSSTTEGAPASLEEPPSSATPAAEPSPIGSIAPSARPNASFDLPNGPAPVTVRTGDTSFHLRPWTYCYLTACVDGMPPPDPPDVGEARRV